MKNLLRCTFESEAIAFNDGLIYGNRMDHPHLVKLGIHIEGRPDEIVETVHAQDGPVKINIFMNGKVGMEAGPYLQERTYASAQFNATRCRFGNFG